MACIYVYLFVDFFVYWYNNLIHKILCVSIIMYVSLRVKLKVSYTKSRSSKLI